LQRLFYGPEGGSSRFSNFQTIWRGLHGPRGTGLGRVGRLLPAQRQARAAWIGRVLASVILTQSG